MDERKMKSDGYLKDYSNLRKLEEKTGIDSMYAYEIST